MIDLDNQLNLTGRFVRDPELRKTEKSDMDIIKFTIAVHTGYGKSEKTIFVDCTAFGKTAITINQWCGKGSIVNVLGELDCNEYEGRDGAKRKAWGMLVETVKFRGGYKEDEKEATEKDFAKEHGWEKAEDDDLPF